METVAAFRASFRSLSSYSTAARSGSTRPDVRVNSNPLLSNSWIQQRIYRMKFGNRKVNFLTRKRTAIEASAQPSDYASSAASIAPLQLESPIGQFLSEILISHPHLVPAAVEQQLDQFQTDRDAEKDKKDPTSSGTELVLYRRIAEVKAHERKKALEEILYALIVQKFMDADVPLVPTLTPSSPDNSDRVDTWPTQEDHKLELLHSPEAYDMIQNHLALILGGRLGDSISIAKISKIKAGQVYAASVMYGYFLKRIDQRFQLEKTIKILPRGTDDEESRIEQITTTDNTTESLVGNGRTHPEVSSWSGGSGFAGVKPSRLRTYVMSFDGETLQRYATIRSEEAVSIVEKHTEALFGRPEIVITPEGTIDSSKDELIKISFGGLKRLVLEAVTFGSILWDVECYVDSRYRVAN